MRIGTVLTSLSKNSKMKTKFLYKTKILNVIPVLKAEFSLQLPGLNDKRAKC